MPPIEQKSFDESGGPQRRKPLLIGCSGGGGHNTAIAGIASYLQEKFGANLSLMDYIPVLYADKSKIPSSARKQISTGINIMHAPIVGAPVREAISHTPIPVLPSAESLHAEVEELSKKEEAKKTRKYKDMLLDVYPAGYESAAIWNVLQRQDKTEELKKLIDLQPKSDKDNYEVVKDFYFRQLYSAAIAGEPFTEVISTQAMALPALCDAVKAYNQWMSLSSGKVEAPQIHIHQYMTDLPTEGAVHFFNALSTLDPEQQQQMKLYGVGMEEGVINSFFPNGNNFAGLFDIPAADNPMIRKGFKKPELDNSTKFHEDVTLRLAKSSLKIKADEQIASVKLSEESFKHIVPLLENTEQKVFVIDDQTNPVLQAEIRELAKRPEYQGRIIPLAMPSEEQTTALMNNSTICVNSDGTGRRNDLQGEFTLNFSPLYYIKKEEQIASIMLGSQAGNDTFEYIEPLLENGVEKVFVFGAQANMELAGRISDFLKKNPQYTDRVIPLGNQGDEEMAPLMSRSNFVIHRGGGGSVMEQMAMQHNKEQTILIHHANSDVKELTSGISWEDKNVDKLTKFLNKIGVHVEKTCPNRAKWHIAEARLIAAVKRFTPDASPEYIENASQYIQSLSNNELKGFLAALLESEKQTPPSLPNDLIQYCYEREKRAALHLDFLRVRLKQGKNSLTETISAEVSKLGSLSQYLCTTQQSGLPVVNPNKYNIRSIVKNFKNPEFNNASPELTAAVKAYQGIDELLEVIKKDETISAHKQMLQFKEKYECPQTQTQLASGSNKIRQIIQDINFILARYFSYFEKKLTFQQEINRHLIDLTINEKERTSSLSNLRLNNLRFFTEVIDEKAGFQPEEELEFEPNPDEFSWGPQIH